ncbi:TetR family transcriptional regulator C-terminal domain-containing protein [Dongia soli]|uniref:TetR family transcriptional regulator C-terminal domain-containing protein n=1 Tax=Dongia soli TaxID=600628 RepID=A0ABU5E614_9PROT|nr:TetR family transcriptional regulator C-terminal domain-containing protein [Dongia soli]MDY0881316.1 TetR family transcriptional regulator C-terminal domain-containing protein [Dongia soli]
MQAVINQDGTERRGRRSRAGTQRNHERTHAAILDATIRTIARHSLSGTTVQRVAAEAGVSVGAVILHYKSKEALLVAALDLVAEDFEIARREALSKAGSDPVAALTALIEVSLNPQVSNPDRVAVWSAFWGEAQARRVYLDRVGTLDNAYQNDLTGLVQQLIETGGYRHLDAEAVALGLAGLLDGQWQDIMVSGETFDRQRAHRVAQAYLAGLFPNEFALTAASASFAGDKHD